MDASTWVVLAVALAASLLTLFTGFGLGSLLLPAFALVFPLDVAVGATAVVHLANNVWKGGLLGRWADGATVLRFGVLAALGSVVGALLLLRLEPVVIGSYELGGPHDVTWIGLVIGGLVAAFAAFDLVPALRAWQVGRQHLLWGGALSGFFGGLSGHQGALRTVFLTKIGLDARAFIATGVLCAILVDVGRLAVYATRYAKDAAAIDAAGGWPLIAGAAAMAFAGATLGAQVIGKVEMAGLRVVAGVAILVVGLLIAGGLL